MRQGLRKLPGEIQRSIAGIGHREHLRAAGNHPARAASGTRPAQILYQVPAGAGLAAMETASSLPISLR